MNFMENVLYKCIIIIIIIIISPSPARSPVFSHLSATLQGLITIRAFEVQENFTRKFDSHQNHHTRTWFLFLTTSRWFGIMLDWMSVTFLSVVALSCIVSADCEFKQSSTRGVRPSS